MRKPDFCICENKGADQLRSNCEADQCLCFRYMDSTIPRLLVPKIFYLASETIQTGLCQTCAETPKTGFLSVKAHMCHNIPDPTCLSLESKVNNFLGST